MWTWRIEETYYLPGSRTENKLDCRKSNQYLEMRLIFHFDFFILTSSSVVLREIKLTMRAKKSRSVDIIFSRHPPPSRLESWKSLVTNLYFWAVTLYYYGGATSQCWRSHRGVTVTMNEYCQKKYYKNEFETARQSFKSETGFCCDHKTKHKKL